VNYTKKRSIAGEVRHYREQKEEIERWEEMKQEKVRRLGFGMMGGRRVAGVLWCSWLIYRAGRTRLGFHGLEVVSHQRGD